jgi:hypothetical protein
MEVGRARWRTRDNNGARQGTRVSMSMRTMMMRDNNKGTMLNNRTAMMNDNNEGL